MVPPNTTNAHCVLADFLAWNVLPSGTKPLLPLCLALHKGPHFQGTFLVFAWKQQLTRPHNPFPLPVLSLSSWWLPETLGFPSVPLPQLQYTFQERAFGDNIGGNIGIILPKKISHWVWNPFKVLLVSSKMEQDQHCAAECPGTLCFDLASWEPCQHAHNRAGGKGSSATY